MGNLCLIHYSGSLFVSPSSFAFVIYFLKIYIQKQKQT